MIKSKQNLEDAKQAMVSLLDALLKNNDIRLVVDSVQRGNPNLKIYKLPGDASARQYYRALLGDESYIIMKTEPFAQSGDRSHFLAVQRYLLGHGINVPHVLYADPERGGVLLEDLGDITLIQRLQSVDNELAEQAVYKNVIDALVKLHTIPLPHADDDNVGDLHLRFDVEKLTFEIEHTIENLFKQYLARNMTEADLATMRESFNHICEIIAGEPLVITHRDFHSRNIMVDGFLDGQDRLVMIDFQDARLGPKQYDLVSLLRDSYYQLSESQIEKLTDYYIDRFEMASGSKVDRNKFKYVFDLMSVQRNFKAIGSFASFMNRRGDAKYLKFIGNTFENIRRVLLKYPEYAALREILFKYYYF